MVFWRRYFNMLIALPVYFVDLYILVICSYFYALVQVFSIFEDLGISVDCVATSEVSISLTLDPSKLWCRELIQQVSLRQITFRYTCVMCQTLGLGV